MEEGGLAAGVGLIVAIILLPLCLSVWSGAGGFPVLSDAAQPEEQHQMTPELTSRLTRNGEVVCGVQKIPLFVGIRQLGLDVGNEYENKVSSLP